jgi:hypothetical protein
MGIYDPGVRTPANQWTGSPNTYDAFFGNIISAFQSSQEALVGPNKFLDLVMTDIDPSNTAYQGKTIEINFPDSAGKIVNMTTAYGTNVTVNPVGTIRRFLTLDQHPTYAFVIPDMDKALAANPQDLRKMFIDEAIKKFTTYVNRTLLNLVYNTSNVVDGTVNAPGTLGLYRIFGTPNTAAGQNSLLKANSNAASGSQDQSDTGMSDPEWLGFKGKGNAAIAELTAYSATTDHTLGIKTLARMWQNLTEAKCPTDDAANMFLLVRPSTFRNIITDAEWTAQSAVGEGIASSVRSSARVNTTFGINVDWDLDVPMETGTLANGGQVGKWRYHNVMFHKRAFAVAYRPLELPPPAVGVQASMAYYKGIPIRFMVSYDPKQFAYVLTFDTLFGAMVYRPEFAIRQTTPWLASL